MLGMQSVYAVLRKDVPELDRVQRRTTDLKKCLEDLNYEDKLQTLNVFFLGQKTLKVFVNLKKICYCLFKAM